MSVDGILAQQLGREVGAVAQGDDHLLGAGHDVLVGEDDAVAPDDEAGAAAVTSCGVPGHEEVAKGTAWPTCWRVVT